MFCGYTPKNIILVKRKKVKSFSFSVHNFVIIPKDAPWELSTFDKRNGGSQEPPFPQLDKKSGRLFDCASSAAHFAAESKMRLPEKARSPGFFRTAGYCTRGGPCHPRAPPLPCQRQFTRGSLTVSRTAALRSRRSPCALYSLHSYPQKRIAAFANSSVGSTKGPGWPSAAARIGSSVQARMK